MYRIVLALVLLGGVPAQAAAATVSVQTIETGNRGGTYMSQTAVYEAAPGEANDLTLGGDATAGNYYQRSAITYRDPGATITPGAGCVVEGDHVRCDFTAEERTATVELGDGNDRARIDAQPGSVHIDGGDGADTLDGFAHRTGWLRLTGGAGDDRLLASVSTGSNLDGGDGSDVLTGGAGGDVLDGGAGDDAIEGGPGRDSLSYRDRDAGIWVDLALGIGGGPGEHDLLGGVEEVNGSDSAPDVLLGGPSGDTLNGHQGRDVIDGRAGDDRLDGGAGGDTLTGGAGRDSLRGLSGSDVLDGGEGDDALYPGTAGRTSDRLACGTGADEIGTQVRLWRNRTLPLLPADCERLESFLLRLRGWSVRGRWLRVDVGAGARFLRRGSCTLTLRTARDEARLKRLRAGRFRAVRLRIPAAGPIALRVTPVSRCQGPDSPLQVPLAAAQT